MKFYFMKAHLMMPKFTEVNLEQGTYESEIIPVFDIVWTVQKHSRWLTFYFFNYISFQIVWTERCKCAMCRRNRLRALLFLKPVDLEGNPLKKVIGQ
jgi:hypothetical protein